MQRQFAFQLLKRFVMCLIASPAIFLNLKGEIYE